MPSTQTPTPATSNGARRPSPLTSAPAVSATAKASARNRTRIVIGSLLMATGALASGLLYANLGDRHPVVAIARPVAAGKVIQQGDLSQALVRSSDGIRTLPWSSRSSIVGRTAAVGLVPGSLLNPAQLAIAATIDGSDAVVGAVLRRGQFPAGLRSGDIVLAIVLPPEAASATGQGHVDPPITATIAAIGQVADSGGGVSVSLAVSPGDAVAVAVAGSRGRLTLVLAPR